MRINKSNIESDQIHQANHQNVFDRLIQFSALIEDRSNHSRIFSMIIYCLLHSSIILFVALLLVITYYLYTERIQSNRKYLKAKRLEKSKVDHDQRSLKNLQEANRYSIMKDTSLDLITNYCDRLEIEEKPLKYPIIWMLDPKLNPKKAITIRNDSVDESPGILRIQNIYKTCAFQSKSLIEKELIENQKSQNFNSIKSDRT